MDRAWWATVQELQRADYWATKYDTQGTKIHMLHGAYSFFFFNSSFSIDKSFLLFTVILVFLKKENTLTNGEFLYKCKFKVKR